MNRWQDDILLPSFFSRRLHLSALSRSSNALSEFPFFLEPVEAVEALSIQWEHTKASAIRPNETISAPCPAPWLDEVKAWLRTFEIEKRQPLLHESLDLVSRIGAPVANWAMAKTLSDALGAARAMGYPVALKAVASSLLHKSEKGAVAVGVSGDEELRRDWIEKIYTRKE